MFHGLEQKLIEYIEVLPLEVFVFVASIVEEIIAPIPSPTVMVLSGSFAEVQGYVLWALIPLAVIGAVGKTIGALVVYTIADKAEDVLMGTFGKFFNVSKTDIEKLGSKLGKGPKDYLFLTFLRALPIMPSVVVSAGSGILKVHLAPFIVSTFFGTIVRDGFYLYAGYVGSVLFMKLVAQTTHWETYVEVAVVVAVLVFIGRRIYAKRTAYTSATEKDTESPS